LLQFVVIMNPAVGCHYLSFGLQLLFYPWSFLREQVIPRHVCKQLAQSHVVKMRLSFFMCNLAWKWYSHNLFLKYHWPTVFS